MDKSPYTNTNTIEDGFGSCWKRCALGDLCGLHVVRPGKVQCACDDIVVDREQLTTAHLLMAIQDLSFRVHDLERKLSKIEE
jgi:hypothetical protein